MYEGKTRLPVESDRLTARELKRILWHEYTHAVIHDLAKGQCPIWLNEGLATLQESRVRSVDLSLARAAFRGGDLPAPQALWDVPYEEEQLALHYQTSFLFAQYLVKRWGWRELVRLLKRMGQGVGVSEALQAQYRTDPATLEKEIGRASCRERV